MRLMRARLSPPPKKTPRAFFPDLNRLNPDPSRFRHTETEAQLAKCGMLYLEDKPTDLTGGEAYSYVKKELVKVFNPRDEEHGGVGIPDSPILLYINSQGCPVNDGMALYDQIMFMRKHYGRSPKTGCKALFVYHPDKQPSPETRYYLWHKTPKRLTFASTTVKSVQDRQAHINTGWAAGHSLHKRLETKAAAGNACQACGATDVPLFVHHPNRLRKAKRAKKGVAHVANAGMQQQTKLLCRACHLAHHHGDTRQ